MAGNSGAFAGIQHTGGRDGVLLVTGATGHVGLTLVRLGANRGLRVVAQHRSPVDPGLASELGPTVEWVRCDLSDPFAIAAMLAEHPVSGCIHTAAVPNDRLARPDPWNAIRSNTIATAALLELGRRQMWRRFVYVSTGSVFQGLTDLSGSILEEHPPQARTVYGVTKLAGEQLVAMYRYEFGMSASTVRISFVYGPPLVPAVRDLPRGPVVALLREAVRGQPIRESSGGDFQASFTHVEDVAEGLLAAYQAPELRHPVYHLGHGRNWTTFQVAEAVADAVPGAIVEVGPGTLPWTTYNSMRPPLGGTRLEEDTGFRPRLPLREGVAAFAAWIMAQPAGVAE
jgi:UDP-glucuronate 4-epimerase